jgi:hypothetical protein
MISRYKSESYCVTGHTAAACALAGAFICLMGAPARADFRLGVEVTQPTGQTLGCAAGLGRTGASGDLVPVEILRVEPTRVVFGHCPPTADCARNPESVLAVRGPGLPDLRRALRPGEFATLRYWFQEGPACSARVEVTAVPSWQGAVSRGARSGLLLVLHEGGLEWPRGTSLVVSRGRAGGSGAPTVRLTRARPPPRAEFELRLGREALPWQPGAGERLLVQGVPDGAGRVVFVAVRGD